MRLIILGVLLLGGIVYIVYNMMSAQDRSYSSIGSLIRAAKGEEAVPGVIANKQKGGASENPVTPTSFLLFAPSSDSFEIPRSMVERYKLELINGKVCGYAPLAEHQTILQVLSLLDSSIAVKRVDDVENKPLLLPPISAPAIATQNSSVLVVQDPIQPPFNDEENSNIPSIQDPVVSPVVVKESDRETMMIEFLYLTAELKKSDSFSFDWLLTVSGAFASPVIRGTPGVLTLQTDQLALALAGAVERGLVVVRSRPFLQVQVGETARLVSGSRVPIAQSNFSNGALNQNVNFEKVGYDMTVSLFKDEKGFYELTIKQDSSSLQSVQEIGGNPVPTISTAIFESNLRCVLDAWYPVGSLGVETSSKNGRLFSALSLRRGSLRSESVLCVRLSRLTTGVTNTSIDTPKKKFFQRMPSVYVKKL